MGPGDLEKLLKGLPEDGVPELLSSIHTGEDAGVFALSDELALVQTVDFFPPVVDDPYTFGQIAASNALSDVYAMGGEPLTALNIVAYPCGIDTGVVEAILRGGHDKVVEAGAVIVGGHTIDDPGLKYGLAVTGTVRPSEMTTISAAVPGDLLVLTKPIGTGILVTALKGEFLAENEMSDAVDSMRALNGNAAAILRAHGVRACTDVTGFGLLCHLLEMLRASGARAEVWAGEVPLFDRVVELGGLGMVPEGRYRNSDYCGESVEVSGGVDPVVTDCLFDPQTSGGLLAAVAPDRAGVLLEELKAANYPGAAIVGAIVDGEPGIEVKEGVSS